MIECFVFIVFWRIYININLTLMKKKSFPQKQIQETEERATMKRNTRAGITYLKSFRNFPGMGVSNRSDFPVTGCLNDKTLACSPI